MTSLLPFPVHSLPSFLLTSTALVLTPTIIMPFFRKNHFPVASRLVVITGGSQGLGLSLAHLLASKGASIVLIARDLTKLAAALTAVRSSACSSTQRFHSISADLTVAAEVSRAFDEIVAWHGSAPDIVWQCAGFSLPGLFLDTSAAELERQFTGNYFSAMHTAHQALRVMTAQPAGERRHIVFTGSVLGLYPLAGYNAYSPAKAALRNLADGLRQECLLYDVGVHCCLPATIYSPGFELEQSVKPELTKILEGADEGQTPEEVARICVAKLEKGQELVVTQFLSELLRAGMWGATRKGNWLWDTLLSWVVAFIWVFATPGQNREVLKHKQKLEAEGKKVQIS